MVAIPLTVVIAVIFSRRKYFIAKFCNPRNCEHSQHSEDYELLPTSSDSSIRRITLLILRSTDIEEALFCQISTSFKAKYRIVVLEEEQQSDMLQNINDWIDNKLKDSVISAIIILEKSKQPNKGILHNVSSRLGDIPKFLVRLCEDRESFSDGMHGAVILNFNITETKEELTNLHNRIQENMCRIRSSYKL